MKVCKIQPGDILICKIDDSNHFPLGTIRENLLEAFKSFGIGGVLVVDGKCEFEIMRPEAVDPAEAIKGLQEIEQELT